VSPQGGYLVPDELVITGGGVGSGTNTAWAGIAVLRISSVAMNLIIYETPKRNPSGIARA
jgi:hypothetical protein